VARAEALVTYILPGLPTTVVVLDAEYGLRWHEPGQGQLLPAVQLLGEYKGFVCTRQSAVYWTSLQLIWPCLGLIASFSSLY
jgi:hypothetical protein